MYVCIPMCVQRLQMKLQPCKYSESKVKFFLQCYMKVVPHMIYLGIPNSLLVT